MKLPIIVSAVSLLFSLSVRAQSALTDGQLQVNGKPYIMLAGELGNSGASCAEDINQSFALLHDVGLNTVLVPIYWDMLEPAEGKYDFTQVDNVLASARQNDLRLVLLWFGAWKNSMSCYAPDYVKKDYKKYPRAHTQQGKPLEIASPFYPEILTRDKKAFEQLLARLQSADSTNRVIMIQIENEIGMLEDARDYSEAAQKEFAKGVPEQLMQHLHKNKSNLHPQLLEMWNANGNKQSGSWYEVFGPALDSDEIFMAWNYALYVEQLAQLAKKYSTRPVYVNAALNSRNRRPGQYPAAGPLAHLKDVWHAAAPHIDFLSPDIYDDGFKGWVQRYALPDNVLFIPEAKRIPANGAQALYVVGEHQAIGFSPFSIENGDALTFANLQQSYDLLTQLTPILSDKKLKRRGLLFDANNPSQQWTESNLCITASHFFTLPWDSRAADTANWPTTGGIIIELSPMEYLIAGNGIVVKFEHPDEHQATSAVLGEDGFALDGNAAQSKPASKGKRIGLLSTEQVQIDKDGKMHAVRRYNGDETHQGRHARIGVDDWQILHVKLYQYQ